MSNEESYEIIDWIIEHSDDGFFILIAPEYMQKAIVERYKDLDIAVYDYDLNEGEYKFVTTEFWIDSQPDKRAYFILNSQKALSTEIARYRLNFSRDMLARLHKNIIFCMTQDIDDLLNNEAYDFCHFIKLKAIFEDRGNLSDLVKGCRKY